MYSSEQKEGEKLTSSKLDPFWCNTAAYTEVKALYHKLIFLKPLCFLQEQIEGMYFRLKLVAVLAPNPLPTLAFFRANSIFTEKHMLLSCFLS